MHGKSSCRAIEIYVSVTNGCYELVSVCLECDLNQGQAARFVITSEGVSQIDCLDLPLGFK